MIRDQANPTKAVAILLAASLCTLAPGCTDSQSPPTSGSPGGEAVTLGWADTWPSGPQDLKWPVASGIPARIINGYGGGCEWPGCGYHQYCRYYAVDLVHGTNRAATLGTWVLAAGRCRVAAVGSDGSRGNYVVLDHGNGLFTEYVHLLCNSNAFLRVGDQLLGGTYIGKIGMSGAAGGVPHLHFVVLVADVGCSGSMRSIPLNGIDGDWNLVVNGVYGSSNPYVSPPRGFNPASCH